MVLLGVMASCKPSEPEFPQSPRGEYVRGGDCSWLTEQEADGVVFRDAAGQSVEALKLMRASGMNCIRLRLWMNPEGGWCGLDDVVTKAKRAQKLGMRVMLDIHYSDFFADPSRQNIPAAWADVTYPAMRDSVYAYTERVMRRLVSEQIVLEWVQIGNETRNGMLWPVGQLWNSNGDIDGGWTRYAQMERAGYDAVKAVSPESQVVVHIDNAFADNAWFFTRLKKEGGRWDVIGLSHYPMMTEWSKLSSWQEANTLCAKRIGELHQKFACPIVLSEVGTLANREKEATRCIDDLRTRLDGLDYFQGSFYWEPQVFAGWRPHIYSSLGWGAYNMGSFTDEGAPSTALLRLWQ